MFGRLWHSIVSPGVSDDEIQAVLDRDPWQLACAHMAYWKTDGMDMGFDVWWRLSKRNWMPPVKRSLPSITEERLRLFLLNFAKTHAGHSGKRVMAEAATRARIALPVMVSPGESMDIELKYRRTPQG